MNSELASKYLSTPAKSAGVVKVHGWGEVLVRALSVADLERITEVEKVNPVEGLLLLVALGVCDDNGELVFNPDDLKPLKSVTVPALKLLGEGITRANSLHTEAITEAKKD